jgi:acetyltransferase-like isoleucine patch superfamily enzyme
MSASTFAFRALRRLVVQPIQDWYDTAAVVTQLEHLESLGQGVVANGPLELGNPAGTRLGDDVSINPHLVVRGSGRLHIGSHVHFGEHVTIITSNHNFEHPECLPYDKKRIAKDVVIGECVWLGDRVIVVPGVTIGEGAILAAGAVVTRDVPPLAIVGGAPADLIRNRDERSYWELKRDGKYLGWPRDYDLVNGRRMRIDRRGGIR